MELVPVVYEHAARFLGKRPWEVSRDAGLLHRAHAEAYRAYRHSPLVVGIDIYGVECEAYGGRVDDTGGNGVPAAVPLLSEARSIPGLRRYSAVRDGRFPLLLTAARELQREFPEANVAIPLGGPFSVAVGLVGLQEILVEMVTDPEPVAEAIAWLAEGQAAAAAEIAAEGFDVIFFESGSAPPLVSPALFREILLPGLRSALRPGRNDPVPPLIMGGDTLRILPELLSTGTRYVVCPMETDRGAFMESMKAHPEVTVRMNLSPGIFAGEDREKVKEEITAAVECAGGRGNTLLGTGVLPYDADPGMVAFARSFSATAG
jgi:uroporphyrinogen-III decarboxylase